jgi:hypothetical protein
VVGFTIGSRGKVPGKTCEKRRGGNNNNKNNNNEPFLWFDPQKGSGILHTTLYFMNSWVLFPGG